MPLLVLSRVIYLALPFSVHTTLIQRFGSALNLSIHFHMLFLDGVCVGRPDGSLHFRWVMVPTSAQLTRLAQTLAQCIGRYLERQGLLERDAENSYLAEAGLGCRYRDLPGLRWGRADFCLHRRSGSELPDEKRHYPCDTPYQLAIRKHRRQALSTSRCGHRRNE